MSDPLGLQWDGNVYELLRCSGKYFRIVGSGSCANNHLGGPKMGGTPNHSKFIPFSIGTHGFRDPYFKKPLFLALDMSVDKKNNTILSHRHEHRQV